MAGLVNFKSQLKKLYKVDPEKAYDVIQGIRQENGGIAPAKAIVEAARPKRSQLHKAFEWDDGKAAEKYRLTQARQLVNHFELVFEDGHTAPAFVSVSVGDKGSRRRGYMGAEEAMNDGDLRIQVLKQALTQLLALETRYKALVELAGIFDAVRNVASAEGLTELTDR